jgi:hypothetical protein
MNDFYQQTFKGACTSFSFWFFILFQFFQTQILAQYTAIPDTIFEQQLIDLGIDSEGTLDGQLLTADANGATGFLIINGLGIRNLKGIKDFTSIDRLFCHQNSIDSLDLSGMSNLTHLYCDHNNMSKLNLDGLVALTYLRCSSNSIIELDVSSAIGLTNLLCQANNIIELDVSSATGMTELNCGVNSISSLDLSQLTNLSYLHCGSNDLEYLNVKNGNNLNVSYFYVTSNPDLDCIAVDDPAWSAIYWTNIDPSAEFSLDCSELCTNLSSPLNGANDVDLDADIYWNEIDSVLGYKVVMGSCSQCTDIADSIDVGNVLTYDPGQMNFSDTIYVTILAYDANGASVGCLEELFYTDDNVLDCTFLTSPVHGSIRVGSNANISWENDPSADGYKLNIGTCSGCTDIANNLDVGAVLTHNPGTFEIGDSIYISIFPYNSNGDLTNCVEEYFVINTKAIFSGAIEYPNGANQSSKLLIIDPVTYELVEEGDSPFYIELDPGSYNVYYRPFQIGAQSYEILNLVLTADLDTVLVLEPYTTPNYFDSAHWSQLVAFGEGADSVNLYVEVNDSFDIDSIYMYNEFFELTANSSLDILKLVLKDDGLGDDLVANDGIFTSEKLEKSAGTYDRGNALSQVYIAYFQIYQGAIPQPYKFQFPSLGFVHPTATSTTPFQQWNDSVFINEQIVNIVRNPTYDHVGDANIVYTIFPDSFDFINSFNPNIFNNSNQHFLVSNNVTGIGLNVFDYSSSYGSNGRLKGISEFSDLGYRPPTNHEVLHQWSNHMTDFFESDVPKHNGYSSVFGVHGGLGSTDGNGNRTPMTIVDDTTVNYREAVLYGYIDDDIAFADLELYMMGVLDTAELQDEYYRIYDPIFQSTNTYTVSQIDTITPQEIISNYGYRYPPPTDTVPIFRTATIVVTSEPLTEAGNMFYSYLAKIWEGSELDARTYAKSISFDEATGYRADMVTKLPAPFCDQTLTLFTPIESGWYKAANKITVLGDPNNNSKINLDAPVIDFININTFGTNTVIETRAEGCGD